MSFGLHNLTNKTANATTPTGTTINKTSQDIYSFSTSSFAGSGPILGLTVLAVLTFVLYKSGANRDVYLTVLVPTTLFLSVYDLLPYSTAVTYITVLAISGLFAWGFYKFALR